ncbi:hypothetical protein J2T17_004543 [Paenibacillus mucilaginosus]|uniref:coagulation factor 5/8 type-like protein n=1 Tax=Paenibacillus mucilaginosus TaxID=61624 RepID=UPI003D253597
MSLSHDFFLIPEEVIIKDGVEWYLNNRDTWKYKVHISDLIMDYMFDTFQWIPTYNPITGAEANGLNIYDLTWIKEPGINKSIRILSHWIGLMREAPDSFWIGGKAIWKEDGQEGFWEEAKYKIDKPEIIHQLTALHDLAIQGAKGKSCILHYGI